MLLGGPLAGRLDELARHRGLRRRRCLLAGLVADGLQRRRVRAGGHAGQHRRDHGLGQQVGVSKGLIGLQPHLGALAVVGVSATHAGAANPHLRPLSVTDPCSVPWRYAPRRVVLCLPLAPTRSVTSASISSPMTSRPTAVEAANSPSRMCWRTTPGGRAPGPPAPRASCARPRRPTPLGSRQRPYEHGGKSGQRDPQPGDKPGCDVHPVDIREEPTDSAIPDTAEKMALKLITSANRRPPSSARPRASPGVSIRPSEPVTVERVLACIIALLVAWEVQSRAPPSPRNYPARHEQ